MPFKLQDLASTIGAELSGDPDCEIRGVATLQNASEGELSFFSNRRYFQHLKVTRASAVILSPDDVNDCPVNSLVCVNPYIAYAKAANMIHPQEQPPGGRHQSAVIDESTVIPSTAFIGANSYIGKDVTIGDGVYIGPGCVLQDNVSVAEKCHLTANITLCRGVTVGSHALFHPGVVIGADGFGIANENGQWLKVPQLGSVRIGEHVELGANTTIDRGALEDTIIEDGVKIDNQVQIGHNVVIGENTAIAGCCGIAGSTRVGKRCMIGGMSAINGHIEICDDVIITGMSGVANSIKKPGMYSSAISITETKLWRKNMVRFKHLDEIARKVTKIENLVKK